MKSAVIVVVSAFAIALGSTSAEAATATTGKGKAQTSQSKAKTKTTPISRSRSKSKSSKPSSRTAATTAVAAALPPLTQAQLDVSQLVQIGRADCEFNESVQVDPDHINFGAFRVKHRGKTYVMVPEETATGAVRLLDRDAGVVWLQIPVKSMLMNMNLGQRMIDACTQPAQRTAQLVAEARSRAAAASLSASGVPTNADGTAPTNSPAATEQSLPLLRN